jgi:hypothetical protein
VNRVTSLMKRAAFVVALSLALVLLGVRGSEDGVVEEDFHLRPGVDLQHVRLVSVRSPPPSFLFLLPY